MKSANKLWHYFQLYGFLFDITKCFSFQIYIYVIPIYLRTKNVYRNHFYIIGNIYDNQSIILTYSHLTWNMRITWDSLKGLYIIHIVMLHTIYDLYIVQVGRRDQQWKHFFINHVFLVFKGNAMIIFHLNFRFYLMNPKIPTNPERVIVQNITTLLHCWTSLS